jgi:outer membrane protein assembly factor BamB
VWGDRLFLTTAIEGDVVPGAKAVRHVADGQDFVHPDAVGADRRHTFKLLALDARDGRLLWERTAWEGTPVDSRHKKASFASPTAVTDGERVYAYFGSEGLYAYDFDGKLAWKSDPGVVGTMGVGVGTSPILYRDLVILLCDEDNGERSYLVALDRRTGMERWRVARKVEVSWATPVVVSRTGRDERASEQKGGGKALRHPPFRRLDTAH